MSGLPSHQTHHFLQTFHTSPLHRVTMGFFSEKITTNKIMLFMLLIINITSSVVMVTGEVYKVGDSAGWTADFKSSYADWASSKTFHVNDVICEFLCYYFRCLNNY